MVVEVELVGFDLLLGLDYSVVRSVLISQMTASFNCVVLVRKVIYRIKLKMLRVTDFY